MGEAGSAAGGSIEGVYIGRGGRGGVPRSPWHNPYVLGRDGGRQDVIRKFDAYLRNSGALWCKLPELKDKVLLCHCRAGDRCHGDGLAAAFANLF